MISCRRITCLIRIWFLPDRVYAEWSNHDEQNNQENQS